MGKRQWHSREKRIIFDFQRYAQTSINNQLLFFLCRISEFWSGASPAASQNWWRCLYIKRLRADPGQRHTELISNNDGSRHQRVLFIFTRSLCAINSTKTNTQAANKLTVKSVCLPTHAIIKKIAIMLPPIDPPMRKVLSLLCFSFFSGFNELFKIT